MLIVLLIRVEYNSTDIVAVVATISNAIATVNVYFVLKCVGHHILCWLKPHSHNISFVLVSYFISLFFFVFLIVVRVCCCLYFSFLKEIQNYLAVRSHLFAAVQGVHIKTRLKHKFYTIQIKKEIINRISNYNLLKHNFNKIKKKIIITTRICKN